MARTNNKYTSINFNHIHEKNVTHNPNPSPSSSPSPFLSHKAHGRMLVLTRPSPSSKPLSVPSPAPAPSSAPPLSPSPKTLTPTTSRLADANDPFRTPEPPHDQISLRPLGRTGAVSLGPVSLPVLEKERYVGSGGGSPRPDKFVPPHLRPGFAGRQERPGPEVFRAQRQHQQLNRPGNFGSPVVQYGEDGRPKSGGGYERVRRAGGELEPGLLDRPRSSGSRPSSSGWNF